MRDPQWLEADQRWQRRHPRRALRLRRITPGEFVPDGELRGSDDKPLSPARSIMARATLGAAADQVLSAPTPPGFEVAVLVIALAPGARARLTVVAPSRLIELDPGDDVLRDAFGRLVDLACGKIGAPTP